jgi:hypothetical protein
MHITYKLLRKTPDEHISLKSVLKYFPDQNELQMRQRMKVIFMSVVQVTAWNETLSSIGIYGVSPYRASPGVLEVEN